MSDPFVLFEQWYAEAKSCSDIKHPTAFCLSTVSVEGKAEGRFLDLRRFDSSAFYFATQKCSRKAMSLAHNTQVALTFWWDPLDRQVRVEGAAEVLPEASSASLFASLPRQSQLLFWASEQGQPLDNVDELERSLAAHQRRFESDTHIPPVERWVAYRVRPEVLEFLELRPDRVHRRMYYQLVAGAWRYSMLQP